MSTPSTIGIIKKDGSVQEIYCHQGGTLGFNGCILEIFYKEPEKVKELISYGDLSVLAENVNPIPNVEHSFNKPQKDVCVYYHRDRGESFNKPNEYPSFEVYKSFSFGDELAFIFNESNSRWYVYLAQTNSLDLMRPLIKESFNYPENQKYREDIYQLDYEEMKQEVFPKSIVNSKKNQTMKNPLFDNEVIEIDNEISLVPMTRQDAKELFSKMTEKDFVSMDPFGTMNNFEVFYSFLSENAKIIVYNDHLVGTFTNKDFCLGFWIIDDYKGQNLAYRVSHEFIKKYSHYAYEAGSFNDNPASLKILEKLGFEKIKEQAIGNKTIYWFERYPQPMEELKIGNTKKMKI